MPVVTEWDEPMLTAHPRVRLITLPTPLQPAERLTKELGGPRIFIKRDDATGLAFGGNKSRKLEYLVAEALQRGATHLITTGAVQSNHVRQTAAAAAAVGLASELVLVGDADADLQGNYLLDRLVGGRTHIIPPGVSSVDTMEELAADLTDSGHRPYVIPGGGSNGVGALGYVAAMLELNYQLWQADIDATHLFHATGSCGTQAGIVLGAALHGAGFKVQGIAVSGNAADKLRRTLEIIAQTADLLGVPNQVHESELIVDDSQVGPGYGMATPECLEAIELLARTEGILLDPVYTAKAFAGLIADVRAGRLTTEHTVVFLHTGGTPALFAKRAELAPLLG
jgi:D-cysteine desulfhydrase family pyridoxal phosphate-dependent enzyme